MEKLTGRLSDRYDNGIKIKKPHNRLSEVM
jgi:hypothetical protein